MKKTIYTLFFLAIVASCGQEEQNEKLQKQEVSAATIYHNGEILPMLNDKVEYAETVVEEEGKIVFVGSKSDAFKKYENAKQVDLEGKLADFVILDKNPLKVDASKIKEINVEATIKEGKWIFEKE